MGSLVEELDVLGSGCRKYFCTLFQGEAYPVAMLLLQPVLFSLFKTSISFTAKLIDDVPRPCSGDPPADCALLS